MIKYLILGADNRWNSVKEWIWAANGKLGTKLLKILRRLQGELTNHYLFAVYTDSMSYFRPSLEPGWGQVPHFACMWLYVELGDPVSPLG
ncbi:uncharacterized protein PHALS_09453 [Plasmopara halstedii]|uniref:Uncharacterized protein n=1 Tax=Plasmopara halstedii TaxID=4781 RepID=A0A0P1A4G0_PLAHL|nr:uncharacterized protein PHALS_09453 [Plasmopara halstedii]CEG35327.1 hypothetical protein PHALS_09453 [Plasmopara halstedii]|eukprot:XP_024571696.1 hypothetical protein PHALS_09453 [Plasmopara halstedii]